MYDYSEVLAMLERSNRFHSELEESFNQMLDGDAGESRAILGKVQELVGHHNLNPMILEVDLEGKITYANEHFLAASKYELEDLLGQSAEILKSSHEEPGKYQDLLNHMENRKPWHEKLVVTANHYESFSVETVVSPVMDASGNITKYWALAYDITEQTSTEQELKNKNTELEDSMKYAKRIQRTILPDKKTMDKVLDDYFTIYKPKDIVSGDFYWFNASIDKVFVAAVDCTGHGVPGAFMSLIGFNLLNQIVLQRRIQAPGLILTELHKGIRQVLKQDAQDSKSRDGMDLSFLVIDRFEDRVQFAGAYNPLYWWSTAKNELVIIKGDKMAIGGEQMEDERTFTNHEIEVKPGDCLYLFSDGFVDQFGGPDNKKFGTKRLKTLIEENHHEKMSVQRALFNLTWRDWVQDDEQIDDVTLIGIKIPEEG